VCAAKTGFVLAQLMEMLRLIETRLAALEAALARKD
jgi:hypothetical protein